MAFSHPSLVVLLALSTAPAMRARRNGSNRVDQAVTNHVESLLAVTSSTSFDRIIF
jgi:hypothetical protein